MPDKEEKSRLPWESLSIGDRANYIRQSVRNGINDPDRIKQIYAEELKMKAVPSKQFYASDFNKRQTEYESDKLRLAKGRANNPDIITKASNFLSYPVTWIAHPSRIGDDIVDIISGRETQTDRENYEDNVSVFSGQKHWSDRPQELGQPYLVNSLWSLAKPTHIPSVILGDYLAKSNQSEASNSASGQILGRVKGGMYNRFGETQSNAGGIADFQQSFQDFKEGNYGRGVFNAITGTAGLFDSSMLPAGTARNVSGAADKIAESLNVIGDVGDVIKPVYDSYTNKKKK